MSCALGAAGQRCQLCRCAVAARACAPGNCAFETLARCTPSLGSPSAHREHPEPRGSQCWLAQVSPGRSSSAVSPEGVRGVSSYRTFLIAMMASPVGQAFLVLLASANALQWDSGLRSRSARVQLARGGAAAPRMGEVPKDLKAIGRLLRGKRALAAAFFQVPALAETRSPLTECID